MKKIKIEELDEDSFEGLQTAYLEGVIMPNGDFIHRGKLAKIDENDRIFIRSEEKELGDGDSCPKCYGRMTSFSDNSNFGYLVCDECGFNPDEE